MPTACLCPGSDVLAGKCRFCGFRGVVFLAEPIAFVIIVVSVLLTSLTLTAAILATTPTALVLVLS